MKEAEVEPIVWDWFVGGKVPHPETGESEIAATTEEQTTRFTIGYSWDPEGELLLTKFPAESVRVAVTVQSLEEPEPLSVRVAVAFSPEITPLERAE